MVRNSKRNVTMFAPLQAPKLVVWCKLTSDERVTVHRVVHGSTRVRLSKGYFPLGATRTGRTLPSIQRGA